MSVAAWRPAVNGTGKHPWFLVSDVHGYHWSKGGTLIRYANHETASAAAKRLNRETQR